MSGKIIFFSTPQYGEDPEVCDRLIKYVEINNLVVQSASKKTIDEAVAKLGSYSTNTIN